MKKTTILKIIVSALLLWWLFSRTDISSIFSSLTNLPILILLAAILLHLIEAIIRSLKWQMLLPRHDLRHLVHMTLVGFYYSMILPGQMAGEAVKAYKLGRKGERAKVAASVLVDKYTGLAALLFISIIGMWISSPPLPKYVLYLLILFLAVAIIVPFLFVIDAVYDFLLRLLEVAERIPFMHLVTGKSRTLIDALRSFLYVPGSLAASFLLGIVFQTIGVSVKIVLAYGFGIAIHPFNWFWIVGFVAIVLLLPISIGGLGLREGSFVGLLALFGMSAETAIAFSLANYGVRLMVAGLGGLLDWKKL